MIDFRQIIPAAASSPCDIGQSIGTSCSAALLDSIESTNMKMIEPGSVIAPSRRAEVSSSIFMRTLLASNMQVIFSTFLTLFIS